MDVWALSSVLPERFALPQDPMACFGPTGWGGSSKRRKAVPVIG